MVPYRLVSIAVAVGALLACSPGDASNPDGDTGEDPFDTGPETDDDDTDGDTDVEIVPTLFSLDGTLTIASGAVDPTTSAVEIGFWTTANGAPESLCVRAPTVSAATDAGTVDDVPLLAWWALTLTTDDADVCPWAVPGGMHVGIGALDSRLYPAMEAHDYDADTVAPYGAYVGYEGADAAVFVYGLAGTDAMLDGTEAAGDTSPIPDGSYRLVGLHLLPLPE